MRIRIGYFDDSTGKGGTTRYLFDLVRGLDRDAFEPVFFSPVAREWHEELRQLDVRIVGDLSLPASLPPVAVSAPTAQTLPANRSPRLRLPKSVAWHLGLAKELRSLYRLFRQHEVDLFHSNNAGAEPAPIAAHWTGKPVVATLHVDSDYDLTGERSIPRYRRLERFCFRSTDCAIAVSQQTGRNWVARCKLDPQYISTRLRTIYNGIDSSRFQRSQVQVPAKQALGMEANAFLIASAGRLEPAKGYEYLVKAIPLLVRTIPNAHVLIAGKGPLDAHLIELADRLGVRDRLHLAGFIPDVAGILNAADLYVQPSLCEALPYAVLEASGFGLPLVVSSAGGMPEIVRECENGLIVEPRSPQQLADAIQKLAQDAVMREHFGHTGRTRVPLKFSLKNMCSETMAIYRQLVRREALPS